jgi:pimeloyl-ACP methyl ester carboxylesterase
VDLLTPANKAMRALLVARGVDSSTVQLRGHAVHRYRLSGVGSGPPVLLLHGLGSSANGFSRVLFELQKSFRAVWAFDLPGNGFSPLPRSGPMPTVDTVEVVLDFIREQVREPVFLVGNSLGGAICLYAASDAPQLVRALGLVSPAGARVEPDRIRALLQSFDVASTAQARALTGRLFHRAPLAMRLLSGQLRQVYGSAAVKGFIRETRDTDCVPPERLKGLSMPTLLVWGRSEKLLPYEGIEYFRAHLPSHAEIHEVHGFGHLPQLERPGELVQLLLQFARKNSLVA